MNKIIGMQRLANNDFGLSKPINSASLFRHNEPVSQFFDLQLQKICGIFPYAVETTKSVDFGARPADGPPLVSDQLAVPDQRSVFAPVQ